MILHCAEAAMYLRRNIDVSDSQENHVSKGVEIPESTGAVLNDFNDAIEPLGYCIGESRTDKGQDLGKVSTDCADELLQRFQSATESSCSPTLEESFGGTGICIIPELLELILQSPRSVDTVVGSLESFECAGVFSRSGGRMAVKEPSQTFERLPLVGAGPAPLLLAHIIDGAVEGLDDMEAIQDQGGVGAMLSDGAHVGLAHVAAGPPDPLFLKGTERLVEKPVNCLTALSLTYPDHTGALEIVDQSGVFVALGVGDFVDAYLPQSSDTVSFAQTSDGTVQQIRESGGWYA